MTAPSSADAQLSLAMTLVHTASAIVGERDISEIEASMGKLVQSIGCDAMVVWRNHVGTHDGAANAEVVYSTAVLPRSLNRDRLKHAAKVLAQGQTQHFATLGDVPAPDRDIYAEAHISAALEHPIFVNGEWAGQVGFFAIDQPRHWGAADFGSLSSIAHLFTSLWERNQAVADRERQVADQSLAMQAILTGAASTLLDPSGGDIESVLPLILESLNGATAYVQEITTREHQGIGLETKASMSSDGLMRDPALGPGEWLPSPPSLTAIREAKPWIISDLATHPQRDWYAAHMPEAAAEVCFPVIADGSVVGLVGVSARSRRDWTPMELGVVATVAHMTGLARARIDANQAMDDIVRAKDRFIAAVSHELRTPMSVVMGLSSELDTRREEFSDEEVAEFIGLMARQSHDVGNIIEDLLVSARANAESITVLPELTRLDQVVVDTLASMSAEQTRNIVSTELARVSTFADPLRLRQIIRNLVTNGHRHGGTSVWIRVGVEDDQAFLEVTDDGPGIPEARRVEVFEAFSGGQVEGRTASIGLGLTVSLQLARLMGGDVAYVHEPLPTFRLVLPVGAIREVHSREGEGVLAKSTPVIGRVRFAAPDRAS